MIVSFRNWGNPRDSIIRGYQRGRVKEIKDKLKRWCELINVNEFQASKLCCCCHCETKQPSSMKKKSTEFSIAATMSAE
jgi:hypothetical protein